MPPDVGGIVRKFIPSNSKLAGIIIRVCESTFRARTLPMPLVKMIVDRAFEEIRRSGNEVVGTKLFEEKLIQYAVMLRPRFQSKINDLNRRGGKSG